MTTTQVLSEDSQVLVLLCSGLGSDGGHKPLVATEWTQLATAIHESPLRRPGALLGLSTSRLVGDLGVSAEMADRLAALLRRSGQLALELERLETRGIGIVTRADDGYPRRLRRALGPTAPALFFVAGQRELLGAGGVAVVGSRDADERALGHATAIGRRCAGEGLSVISGAARGIDTAAMTAATDTGGAAVGIVADALERMVRRRELRHELSKGRILLASTEHPEARFTVWRAMARNRIVYALADAAIVVASGSEGGTWQGAVENLRAAWTPLHVMADDLRPGNRELIERGGMPLRQAELDGSEPLRALLARSPRGGGQLALLDDARPARAPASDMPYAGPSDSGASEDLFPHIWPRMQPFLRVPRSENDLAAAFHLQPSQARAWLSRAIDAGLVERTGRPKRYRLRT